MECDRRWHWSSVLFLKTFFKLSLLLFYCNSYLLHTNIRIRHTIRCSFVKKFIMHSHQFVYMWAGFYSALFRYKWTGARVNLAKRIHLNSLTGDCRVILVLKTMRKTELDVCEMWRWIFCKNFCFVFRCYYGSLILSRFSSLKWLWSRYV